MAYRDELGAAHHRSAALEREMAERDQLHAARERALKKKIARLEQRIEALGAGPSRERRLVDHAVFAAMAAAIDRVRLTR